MINPRVVWYCGGSASPTALLAPAPKVTGQVASVRAPLEWCGASAEVHGLAAGPQQGRGGAERAAVPTVGIAGFGEVLPLDRLQHAVDRSAVVGERGAEGGIVQQDVGGHRLECGVCVLGGLRGDHAGQQTAAEQCRPW